MFKLNSYAERRNDKSLSCEALNYAVYSYSTLIFLILQRAFSYQRGFSYAK